MPTTYEEYEWWDGADWVSSETFIAHTDPDEFVFTNAEWGDTTQTYELSVAVMDDGLELSAYSNAVVLNPYEWWDGDSWVDSETSIAHTDPDSIDLDAMTFDIDGVYHVALEVWDEGDLSSDYSNEKWFMVITPVTVLEPVAIPSAESLGMPSLVLGTVTLQPVGGVSSENIPAPTLAASITISPNSIESLASVGIPEVSIGPLAITPTSIASLEAFGVPDLIPQAVTLIIDAIASEEALGTPNIYSTIAISPPGVGSAEVFGLTEVIPGTVVITVAGIESAELFGIPFVKPPAYDWSWTGEVDQRGRMQMAKQGYLLLVNTSGDIILLNIGNPPGGLELLD